MKMPMLKPCNADISSINRKKLNKHAVTLVELIIAMFILSLAILPAVGTFSTYFSTSTRQMEQEMALKIAESVINLFQTVSYELIQERAIDSLPLDIQTPDGTVKGTLVFKNNPDKIVGESADGKSLGVDNNSYLQACSEDIHINRRKYKVEVNVVRVFRPQVPSTPHKEALDFTYYDCTASETVKYSCQDNAFVFNVTVKFGKANPIKLSSFRVDMVK